MTTGSVITGQMSFRIGLRPLFALAAGLLLLAAPAARATELLEVAGNVLYVFLPAVAWGGTYIDDDSDGRSQYYRALGSMVALTLAANYLADEEGPDGRDYSFPSSHAAVSFSAASFVQRRYGWRYAWPLYGGAALAAWSRVEIEANEWRDVLTGAALGIGFSYWFIDQRPDEDGRIAFLALDGGYGLMFERKW